MFPGQRGGHGGRDGQESNRLFTNPISGAMSHQPPAGLSNVYDLFGGAAGNLGMSNETYNQQVQQYAQQAQALAEMTQASNTNPSEAYNLMMRNQQSILQQQQQQAIAAHNARLQAQQQVQQQVQRAHQQRPQRPPHPQQRAHQQAVQQQHTQPKVRPSAVVPHKYNHPTSQPQYPPQQPSNHSPVGVSSSYHAASTPSPNTQQAGLGMDYTKHAHQGQNHPQPSPGINQEQSQILAAIGMQHQPQQSQPVAATRHHMIPSKSNPAVSVASSTAGYPQHTRTGTHQASDNSSPQQMDLSLHQRHVQSSQDPSTIHQPNKPRPAAHVPYKMTTLDKHYANPKNPSPAREPEPNRLSSDQAMHNMPESLGLQPKSQAQPQVMKRPNIIPHKMDAMKRSHLRLQETPTERPGLEPPLSLLQQLTHHQQQATRAPGPVAPSLADHTGASTTDPSPPKVSRRPIIPHKSAAMNRNKIAEEQEKAQSTSLSPTIRPLPARTIPYKSAGPRPAVQKPPPQATNESSSGSGSDSNSSSSSSSSDESADDEKEEKKTTPAPNPTPLIPKHPTVPMKRPLGKPVGMFEELQKKPDPPAIEPVAPKGAGGKYASMKNYINQKNTEPISDEETETSQTAAPSEPKKRRGRPPKAGKSPVRPAPTPTQSFEAISDTEEKAPEKPVPKRGRGRPPKGKGKTPPSASKEAPTQPISPGPPPTPRYHPSPIPANQTPMFEIPPTPRFDPSDTPKQTPSAPPTPYLSGDRTPAFNVMKSPKQTPSAPPTPSISGDRTPGFGVMKSPVSQSKEEQNDSIKDLVSNISQNIKTNLSRGDEFELGWPTPRSTIGESQLPPYVPTTPSLNPPYTPQKSGFSTPFTPFMTPQTGEKTPGFQTPYANPAYKTPASLDTSVIKTPSVSKPEAQSFPQGGSNKRGKRPKAGRKGRSKAEPPREPEPEPEPEIPEEDQHFFRGLSDMPPMNVSGASFSLQSRDTRLTSQDKPTEFQKREDVPLNLGRSGGLFDFVEKDRPEKQDDEIEDIQLPAPDAPFRSRDKKKHKHKDGRRQSRKIKDRDPVFLANMEDLSNGISSCKLDSNAKYEQPKYIAAFGTYALVNPPKPIIPPKPVIPSPEVIIPQSPPNKKKRRLVNHKPKNSPDPIRIKVKLDDVRPPSIEYDPTVEKNPSVPETPTPEVEKPEPIPEKNEPEKKREPTPPPAVPVPIPAEKQPLTERNLTATEVGSKYYVPRKNAIASKNISFKKSKQPKYGPGSKTSPQIIDHEAPPSDRRQLPARKTRPPDLTDSRDEGDEGDDFDFEPELPIGESAKASPKRGKGRPGRPPKILMEESVAKAPPATNLVRTNQMFLPLKKRHILAAREDAGEVGDLPSETMELELSNSPPVAAPPSGSRKRGASSALQRELASLAGESGAPDILDDKKRRRAAVESEHRNQQGCSFSELQAMIAQVVLRRSESVSSEKKRKNTSPAKKVVPERTFTPTLPAILDTMTEDSNDSIRGKVATPTGKKKSKGAKKHTDNYKKINKCIYTNGLKPMVPNFEPHACNCKAPADARSKSCHEECINRIVFIECTPGTCPCGEQCANMRIQKHETVHGLENIQTLDRGSGVKTTNLICAGEFILEYAGEVVTTEEFRMRMMEDYSKDHHHYCLNLDSKFVIDGYRMGNIGRFVNHSCQPNCEMQKWNVNGVYRIGLFASHDIRPGEELTYDYNFKAFNMDAQQKCCCGSSNCRGVMGGRSQKIVQDLTSKSKKGKIGKDTKARVLFNPKDPSVVRQRVIAMPNQEKTVIRGQHCFLMRNLLSLGKIDDIVGKKTLPQTFRDILPFKTETKIPQKEYRVPSKTETRDEEVIRCVCGIMREDGEMLMCDKCEVWQHIECVGASPDQDNYLCDRCDPRVLSGEVAMSKAPDDGVPEYQYYLSLEHEKVHVAVGDAVYMVPRDPGKHHGVYSFRIERLWKDPRGDKFVYGFYYYLPWKLPFKIESRKFFPNEVVQTRFYDILPLKNVRGHCYVIDEKSYSSGRPKDYKSEKDIFICELWLDKTLLKKIGTRREAEMVNKYHYAFNYFKNRLKLSHYQMPILKKLHDAPIRENRQLNVTKPKRKRKTGVEKIMQSLATRLNVSLVETRSITAIKNVPSQPSKAQPTLTKSRESKSSLPSKPLTIIKQQSSEKLTKTDQPSKSLIKVTPAERSAIAAERSAKAALIEKAIKARMAENMSDKQAIKSAEKLDSKSSNNQDAKRLEKPDPKPSESTTKPEQSSPSKKMPPPKVKGRKRGRQSTKTTERETKSDKSESPPPKVMKALEDETKKLPRIPKKKQMKEAEPAAAKQKEEKTPPATLRRGRSSVNRSPETVFPERKVVSASLVDKKKEGGNDDDKNEDAKEEKKEGKKELKEADKPTKDSPAVDKPVKATPKKLTKAEKKAQKQAEKEKIAKAKAEEKLRNAAEKSAGKEKEKIEAVKAAGRAKAAKLAEQAKPAAKQPEPVRASSDKSKQPVLKLQKLDKPPEEKAKLTISPLDSSDSTPALILGGPAKSPNVHVKTPIRVKRTEPAKQTLLTTLLTNQAPPVSILKQKEPLPTVTKKVETPTPAVSVSAVITTSAVVKTSALITTSAVVKTSAVITTSAVVKTSAVVTSSAIVKPSESSVTISAISKPVETKGVSEAIKLGIMQTMPVLRLSPLSFHGDQTSINLSKTPISKEAPSSVTTDKVAKLPDPPAKPPTKRLKKVVDIAEVLRRGKEAQKQKEESNSEEKKLNEDESKQPKKPKESEAIEKPAPASAEILSPTTEEPLKGPLMIPLSPTAAEASEPAEPEACTPLTKAPVAIPLSPSANPASPDKAETLPSEKKPDGPGSPTTTPASPGAAPASPSATPASPDKAFKSQISRPMSPELENLQGSVIPLSPKSIEIPLSPEPSAPKSPDGAPLSPDLAHPASPTESPREIAIPLTATIPTEISIPLSPDAGMIVDQPSSPMKTSSTSSMTDLAPKIIPLSPNSQQMQQRSIQSLPTFLTAQSEEDSDEEGMLSIAFDESPKKRIRGLSTSSSSKTAESSADESVETPNNIRKASISEQSESGSKIELDITPIKSKEQLDIGNALNSISELEEACTDPKKIDQSTESTESPEPLSETEGMDEPPSEPAITEPSKEDVPTQEEKSVNSLLADFNDSASPDTPDKSPESDIEQLDDSIVATATTSGDSDQLRSTGGEKEGFETTTLEYRQASAELISAVFSPIRPDPKQPADNVTEDKREVTVSNNESANEKTTLFDSPEARQTLSEQTASKTEEIIPDAHKEDDVVEKMASPRANAFGSVFGPTAVPLSGSVFGWGPKSPSEPKPTTTADKEDSKLSGFELCTNTLGDDQRVENTPDEDEEITTKNDSTEQSSDDIAEHHSPASLPLDDEDMNSEQAQMDPVAAYSPTALTSLETSENEMNKVKEAEVSHPEIALSSEVQPETKIPESKESMQPEPDSEVVTKPCDAFEPTRPISENDESEQYSQKKSADDIVMELATSDVQMESPLPSTEEPVKDAESVDKSPMDCSVTSSQPVSMKADETVVEQSLSDTDLPIDTVNQQPHVSHEEEGVENLECLENKDSVITTMKESIVGAELGFESPKTTSVVEEITSEKDQTSHMESNQTAVPAAYADEPSITSENQIMTEDQNTTSGQPEVLLSQSELSNDRIEQTSIESQPTADTDKLGEHSTVEPAKLESFSCPLDPVSPIHEPESPVHEPELLVLEPELSVHKPESAAHESVSPVHKPESALHEPESSVHEPESVVHEPEYPVHEPESAVHEPELPVHEPESAVHERESPDHEPESVHKPELPVHEPASPVHEPESPVHEPESPVHEPEPVVHKPELPVDEPASPVHEPKSPVHGSESPVHKPESSVHEPESVVHEPESPVHEPESAVHEPESPVHEPESAVHEPESPIKEPTSPVHEPESPVHEPESPDHEPESVVHKPELPVDEPASPVHEPESPVHGSESPVHKPESSVHEPESPVHEPESVVHGSESPVQELESSVREQESFVHESESPVHEPESPVHEPESSVHEPESPVREPESAVREPESPIQRSTSSVHKPESSVHEPESPVHRSESPVHKPKSPVHEPESPVHEPESAVNQPELPVQELESSVHERESFVHESESPVHEPELPVHEPESPVHGLESSVHEPESSVQEPESAVHEPKSSVHEPELPGSPVHESESLDQESQVPADPPESPTHQPQVSLFEPELSAQLPESLDRESESPGSRPELPTDEPESPSEAPSISILCREDPDGTTESPGTHGGQTLEQNHSNSNEKTSEAELDSGKEVADSHVDTTEPTDQETSPEMTSALAELLPSPSLSAHGDVAILPADGIGKAFEVGESISHEEDLQEQPISDSQDETEVTGEGHDEDNSSTELPTESGEDKTERKGTRIDEPQVRNDDAPSGTEEQIPTTDVSGNVSPPGPSPDETIADNSQTLKIEADMSTMLGDSSGPGTPLQDETESPEPAANKFSEQGEVSSFTCRSQAADNEQGEEQFPSERSEKAVTDEACDDSSEVVSDEVDSVCVPSDNSSSGKQQPTIDTHYTHDLKNDPPITVSPKGNESSTSTADAALSKDECDSANAVSNRHEVRQAEESKAGDDIDFGVHYSDHVEAVEADATPDFTYCTSPSPVPMEVDVAQPISDELHSEPHNEIEEMDIDIPPLQPVMVQSQTNEHMQVTPVEAVPLLSPSQPTLPPIMPNDPTVKSSTVLGFQPASDDERPQTQTQGFSSFSSPEVVEADMSGPASQVFDEVDGPSEPNSRQLEQSRPNPTGAADDNTPPVRGQGSIADPIDTDRIMAPSSPNRAGSLPDYQAEHAADESQPNRAPTGTDANLTKTDTLDENPAENSSSQSKVTRSDSGFETAQSSATGSLTPDGSSQLMDTSHLDDDLQSKMSTYNDSKEIKESKQTDRDMLKEFPKSPIIGRPILTSNVSEAATESVEAKDTAVENVQQKDGSNISGKSAGLPSLVGEYDSESEEEL